MVYVSANCLSQFVQGVGLASTAVLCLFDKRKADVSQSPFLIDFSVLTARQLATDIDNM